jgi:RNA polymerase sigma-70 factor (ECF subfamily)
MATIDPNGDFHTTYARAIAQAWRRSGAARWPLSESAFAQALNQSVRSWRASLARVPSPGEVETYLCSLHAEDLALACACRMGLASAWEYFIASYRDSLHAAARAIARDTSAAAELADSLYADLYGLDQRGGMGRSPLDYFHGRSSLKTWLRAVLGQRHVDTLRAMRRLEPLDETAAETSAGGDPPDPDRTRYIQSFAEALSAAIEELKPRDRMRLNFYHAEELTLRQIGALMNERESSVSRRLERTRKQLRQAVERTLRRALHLSEDQIRLCYAYAIESWTADLGRLLSGS